MISDSSTTDETQVASGMQVVAADRHPAGIVGIGDNINDSNAEGNPQLIVDREPRTSGFWYKQSVQGQGLSVDIFFIDTQIWKGSSRAEAVVGGGARQEQIAWLTEELSSSTADWKFVFGRHPVDSAGSTKVMLEGLDPLLLRFGAKALFSGHDRSQQLAQYRGMNYIVTGTPPRLRSDSQTGVVESLDFAGISICDASTATVTFYDADGYVISAAHLSSTQPGSAPEGHRLRVEGR